VKKSKIVLFHKLYSLSKSEIMFGAKEFKIFLKEYEVYVKEKKRKDENSCKKLSESDKKK
jgi:hypothetical protein